MRTLIVVDARDNVAVALRELKAGETVTAEGGEIKARQNVPRNHKIALRDIAAQAPVVKYGETIGTAKFPIQAGSWVHLHNMRA